MINKKGIICSEYQNSFVMLVTNVSCCNDCFHSVVVHRVMVHCVVVHHVVFPCVVAHSVWLPCSGCTSQTLCRTWGSGSGERPLRNSLWGYDIWRAKKLAWRKLQSLKSSPTVKQKMEELVNSLTHWEQTWHLMIRSDHSSVMNHHHILLRINGTHRIHNGKQLG